MRITPVIDLKRRSGFWSHVGPGSLEGSDYENPFLYMAEFTEYGYNSWLTWARVADAVQIQWEKSYGGADMRERGMIPACFNVYTSLDATRISKTVLHARRKINGKWHPWWSDC